MKYIIFLLVVFLALVAEPLQAQYFGRNKPRYQDNEFKVSETKHFTIYEYLNNPEKLKELAASAELWYQMHQAALQDTFTEKNPLLIYSDHAGFHQTNAIMGDIGGLHRRPRDRWGRRTGRLQSGDVGAWGRYRDGRTARVPDGCGAHGPPTAGRPGDV